MDYPQTFIKDVAIEISNDYSFDNVPHFQEAGGNKKPSIGRKDETDKFKQMLQEGNGVFLVTGYRA